MFGDIPIMKGLFTILQHISHEQNAGSTKQDTIYRYSSIVQMSYIVSYDRQIGALPMAVTQEWKGGDYETNLHLHNTITIYSESEIL